MYCSIAGIGILGESHRSQVEVTGAAETSIMNTCKDTDEILRLLDGELTTLGNAWIETHIEHCEECRETFERL